MSRIADGKSNDIEKSDAATMPTIKLTTRHDKSLPMMLLHILMRPFQTRIVKTPMPLPAGSQRLTPHKRAIKKLDASEREVEGIYLYDLTPKKRMFPSRMGGEKRTSKKRVFWFAGGGWQSPPSSEHWLLFAEMVAKLPDTALTLVSYPLAPNSPAPEAFLKLSSLYRRLMRDAEDSGEQVILGGDSAGGNIVLSILINALSEDEQTGVQNPCPANVFAMAPSTDLRRSNPEMKQVEKKDPLLRISFVKQTSKAWQGSWSPDDPRISPLLADVTPLAKRGVKVHGMTGGYDILSPDAILFREKCNKAGVSGEWLHWDRQMHCFPLAFSFKLRESIEAKDWMLDLLKRI